MKSTRTVNGNGVIEYHNENGFLHRTDGPAFEGINGYKAWYINNKRHREDGPAIEWSDGYSEYYLNDTYYDSKKEWEQEAIKLKLMRLKDL
jgi:hypothetical protein